MISDAELVPLLVCPLRGLWTQATERKEAERKGLWAAEVGTVHLALTFTKPFAVPTFASHPCGVLGGTWAPASALGYP